MVTRNKSSFFFKPLVIATVGCVMALAVGCGDDDAAQDAPAGGTKNTGGTAGSGGTANGGAGTDKAGSDSGDGKAGSDNTVEPVGGTTGTGTGGEPTVPGGDAGAAGMAGAGGAPVVCTDDADQGCYSCAPKTHEQFLNQCPTTGCEPFDNAALTSIKNGKLPDLP